MPRNLKYDDDDHDHDHDGEDGDDDGDKPLNRRCKQICNDDEIGDDHDHDGDGDDEDDRKPLNRNGKGGEDAPAHAGVGERVDHVGEQDREHVAVRLDF